MRRIAPIAAILLAATLGGCGVLAGSPPTNRCASDSDCTSGTCNVELGMCVRDTSTSYLVGLEVTPTSDPFGGTTVPVSFEPFLLEGPIERDLPVPVGVPTYGLVRDDSTGLPVAGDVTMSLVSEIPGGPAVRITAQSRAETMRDERDGYVFNFATQILPGRLYDITVQPTSEWRSKRPPLRVRTPYVSPDGGSTRLEFLRYPDFCSAAVLLTPPPDTEPDCLVAVEGSIVDASGAPQNDVLVRVVATAGTTLSSTYTTGADPSVEAGAFRVVLHYRDWFDAESWFFQVGPSADRVASEGPSPEFTVSPASLFEVDGRVTILTPDVESVVTYTGWVEAEVGNVALEGATLQFRANEVVDDVTGVIGSFSAQTTSTSEGLFEVRLLPGTYDVVVTPAQAELSVMRTQVIIAGDASGQLFRIPEGSRFGGTVRTNGGLGMINARVRAQARSSDMGGALAPVALYARSNDTLTDLEGRFGLPLDVGLYDFVIEPPVGTNFPWLVVPDQTIGGSAAPLTNVYTLENPVPVSGVAAYDGPDGPIPMAGAQIRAYAVIEGEAGTRAIQIGRVETDSEGRYTLLLPPSI